MTLADLLLLLLMMLLDVDSGVALARHGGVVVVVVERARWGGRFMTPEAVNKDRLFQ